MKKTVKAYLARNPHEAAGLRALQAQLADDRDIFLRSNMRGHLTSSMLVLDETRARVLVIHHKAYNRWLPPGGHAEQPCSLFDSALREAEEETGVTDLNCPGAWSLAPIPLDINTHAIAAQQRKNEGKHWHHDFVYLGMVDEPYDPVPQIEEVHSCRWLDLAEFANDPDETNQRLARKVQPLIAAGMLPRARALA
ncbi:MULTISPECIES: NUDIX domain-containing protein [unclassified Variovorax]|uniref:NUDIX hydrolase n=1 Tax=unclassified Variovorax TaxID=663243 RepID=UPI00076C20A9|nr:MULTISPECIES: NUDIX domain-containing protein [unclassified Variovorax]KWT95544.1 NUDIX hydrolase [Variovorax sp. WDL1]